LDVLRGTTPKFMLVTACTLQIDIRRLQAAANLIPPDDNGQETGSAY